MDVDRDERMVFLWLMVVVVVGVRIRYTSSRSIEERVL